MFIGKNATYSHFGPENPSDHQSASHEIFDEQDIRSHSSFVLLGEPGSGKSTIARRILKQIGAIAPENNYFPLSEAEDRAKPEAHMVLFEGPEKRVTMIDAPAKKEFLANIARGMLFIEHVVFVVDAEQAITPWNETINEATTIGNLELKIAANMLTPSIIVVVNKLDMFKEDAEWKFDQVRNTLEPVISALKFGDIQFIPGGKTETPWYKGPSLLEAVQKLKYAVNTDETLVALFDNEEPEVVNEDDDVEVKCYGRVLANRIKTNDGQITLCNIMNQNEEAEVLDVEGGYASQGQYAEFVLGGITNDMFNEIKSTNGMLCDQEYTAEPYGSGGGDFIVLDKPIALDQTVTHYWAGVGFPGKVKSIQNVRDQNGNALEGPHDVIPPFHIATFLVEPDTEQIVFSNATDLTPQFQGRVVVADDTLLAAGHDDD